MFKTEVRSAGPLFDGRADAAVDAFLDEAQQDVADAGVNMVQAELGRVLQNPTGYYQSRVVTDLSTEDPRVTDSNVVYGPWLEGVESRNRTTRFKGYATFRRVTQVLQARAGQIAQQTLPQYLRRMN